jgi:hypothetical protein
MISAALAGRAAVAPKRSKLPHKVGLRLDENAAHSA